MEASKASKVQAGMARTRDRRRRDERGRRHDRRDRHRGQLGAIDVHETCSSCGLEDDLGAMFRGEGGAVCSTCHHEDAAEAGDRAARADLGGPMLATVIVVQTWLPWSILADANVAAWGFYDKVAIGILVGIVMLQALFLGAVTGRSVWSRWRTEQPHAFPQWVTLTMMIATVATHVGMLAWAWS